MMTLWPECLGDAGGGGSGRVMARERIRAGVVVPGPPHQEAPPCLANEGLAFYPQYHYLLYLLTPRTWAIPWSLAIRTSSIPASLTFETCFSSWLSDSPLMPLRMQTSLQVWGPAGLGKWTVSRVIGAKKSDRKARGLDGSSGELGRSKVRERMDTRQVA